MQRQPLHLHLRSSLQVARILLEEVLDGRHAAEDPEAHAQLVGKAGGEVAMLLRLALRASDATEDRTLIHQLANNLAPAVRTPRVRRCLVLRPSRAPMHAMAHLCLQSLGDRFRRGFPLGNGHFSASGPAKPSAVLKGGRWRSVSTAHRMRHRCGYGRGPVAITR